MSSRKQLVELCAKFVTLTKRRMRAASLNRIIMIWMAASLLVAITAATGKAAELTSLGSSTPSLDALAYDAISESVLWSFGAATDDGIQPFAGLIADKWGNLYGTTSSGGVGAGTFFGSGGGTVFELSPPAGKSAQWTESVLWNFGLVNDDGRNPYVGASLIADKWGNLFGLTVAGGDSTNCLIFGCGTVFELSPPTGKQAQWSERVLYNFGATSDDGIFPFGSLIADKWGNLFGTTNGGGAYGPGTAFELSPPAGKSMLWTESVLWNFGATSDDGQFPEAALLADKWGNLYGTTYTGGANCAPFGCGTVFELSPPTAKSTRWSESVLWNFGATSDDGSEPIAELIADKWGNLYGTTYTGGANCDLDLGGCGTAFELSPPTGKQTQWTESVLWNFPSASGDGFQLYAGLIADKWGNLYGATSSGGANCPPFGCGTVFELAPPADKSSTQWSESVLWSFDGDDGYNPLGTLIFDKWGDLYGTTQIGGVNDDVPGLGAGAGTAFELRLP
jgi:uncharacterized repeat protein (TIGR03803 family)